MPSKSKIKGNYHENWFVKLFNSWKLPAKKVPLSGSLGGEHTGDIKLIINDKEYVVEIKYRAVDKFPSVFKVLQGKDIAMYKRKTGDPRWVAIIPDKIFKEIIKMKCNLTCVICKRHKPDRDEHGHIYWHGGQ